MQIHILQFRKIVNVELTNYVIFLSTLTVQLIVVKLKLKDYNFIYKDIMILDQDGKLAYRRDKDLLNRDSLNKINYE